VPSASRGSRRKCLRYGQDGTQDRRARRQGRSGGASDVNDRSPTPARVRPESSLRPNARCGPEVLGVQMPPPRDHFWSGRLAGGPFLFPGRPLIFEVSCCCTVGFCGVIVEREPAVSPGSTEMVEGGWLERHGERYEPTQQGCRQRNRASRYAAGMRGKQRRSFCFGSASRGRRAGATSACRSSRRSKTRPPGKACSSGATISQRSPTALPL